MRDSCCFRRLTAACLTAACLTIAAAGAAYAETNAQSIAVPAFRTQGVASVYPSTIVVHARGGPTQTGVVTAALHRVTHPCPEELAILLVRNGTEKFLLMSNAGGCRPLQGTTMRFSISIGGAIIPDAQPAAPPYDDNEPFRASNYGAEPNFSAPAPAGPYTNGAPPATTVIEGTWELFVIDTASGNRGVIAGGWSIEYDTGPSFDAQQTNVSIPGGGGTSGPAGAYPITFDLTTVPADVTRRLHELPDRPVARASRQPADRPAITLGRRRRADGECRRRDRSREHGDHVRRRCVGSRAEQRCDHVRHLSPWRRLRGQHRAAASGAAAAVCHDVRRDLRKSAPARAMAAVDLRRRPAEYGHAGERDAELRHGRPAVAHLHRPRGRGGGVHVQSAVRALRGERPERAVRHLAQCRRRRSDDGAVLRGRRLHARAGDEQRLRRHSAEPGHEHDQVLHAQRQRTAGRTRADRHRR